MADAGEIKAKVTIEYDGSGVEQAKSDLEELGKMAGAMGENASGAGEEVGNLKEALAAGEDAVIPFAEANKGAAEALANTEEEASNLNDTLQEHADTLDEATQGSQAFGEQTAKTADTLENAQKPVQQLTEGTQTLAEQTVKANDAIAQTQQAVENATPSVEQLTSSTQDVAPALAQVAKEATNATPPVENFSKTLENIPGVEDGTIPLPQISEALNQMSQESIPAAIDNMAALQKVMDSPEAFNTLKSYLMATGQTLGDFYGSIGDFNADTVGNVVALQAALQSPDTFGAINDYAKSTGQTLEDFFGTVGDANAYAATDMIAFQKIMEDPTPHQALQQYLNDTQTSLDAFTESIGPEKAASLGDTIAQSMEEVASASGVSPIPGFMASTGENADALRALFGSNNFDNITSTAFYSKLASQQAGLAPPSIITPEMVSDTLKNGGLSAGFVDSTTTSRTASDELYQNLQTIGSIVGSNDPLVTLQKHLDATNQSWQDFAQTVGQSGVQQIYDAINPQAAAGGTSYPADLVAQNQQIFDSLATEQRPLGALQDYLGGSGQNIGGFMDSIGVKWQDVAGQIQQANGQIGGSFVDTKQAMTEFEQADPFTPLTNNAEKSGGILSSIFGENGFLSSSTLSEVGDNFKSIGGFFGDMAGGIGEGVNGLIMGFDQVMRPLMYAQMAIQMGGAAASWIYNANLAAEGPAGAASPYSYTSQANMLASNFTQGSNQFAVGIGQGLLPSLEGWNAGSGTQGGDPWKGLGDVIGGIVGGLGSTLQIVGGLGTMGIGGLVNLFGGGSGLLDAGKSWFTSGGEGAANLIAQVLGQPAPYTVGASTIYQGQDVQAAYAQSHYGGTFGATTYETSGPYDPMGSYEQQVARYTSHPMSVADYNLAIGSGSGPGMYYTAPSPDVAADWQYFNAMPLGAPGPSYKGSGGYGGTISQQDAQNQMDYGKPQNIVGGIASLISGGNPGTIEAGNTVGNNIGGFFGGIGQAFNNIGSGFMHIWDPTGTLNNLGATGASGSFDGGCFVAGTKVLMEDGTEKPIETVQKGEHVLTYDGEKQCSGIVLAWMTFPQKQTYQLTFSNGTTLTTTNSHPLYSPKLGWVSLDPIATKQENPTLPVSTLRTGTTIATVQGICTLLAIQKKSIEQVYNICVSGQHTYYANGILVHNIKFSSGGGGAQSFSSGSMPELKWPSLPEIKWPSLPEIKWPSLPEIKWPSLPEIKWPSLPEIKWPSLPEIKWPSLPEIKWPSLPEIKWPSLPEIKWPALPEIKWPSLPEIKWPALPEIKWPALPEIHWPALPSITWPALPTITWPALPSFTWPSLPTITWPSLPSFTWPSLPSFNWPSLPEIHWPALPEIKWPAMPEFHWPALPEFHWPPMPNLVMSIFSPGIPGFATGIEGFMPPGGASAGLAIVGESGPELVSLPAGASVYPMAQGPRLGGDITPLSLGNMGGGGNGHHSANIVVALDSYPLIQALGVPLAQNVRLGMGGRSF